MITVSIIINDMKRPLTILLLAILAAVAAAAVAACSGGATAASSGGKIVAVGAENQYADVIAQVGGQYVKASAVMSNPSPDTPSLAPSLTLTRASAPPPPSP